MNSCPIYNGQNINFTGNINPYKLIQNAGRRRKRRTMRRKKRVKKSKKTKKYRTLI